MEMLIKTMKKSYLQNHQTGKIFKSETLKIDKAVEERSYSILKRGSGYYLVKL